MKRVRKGSQGIVKISRSDGTLDLELWSAESECEIEEGKKARVAGIRSIVLLIEPLKPAEIARNNQ